MPCVMTGDVESRCCDLKTTAIIQGDRWLAEQEME